MAIAAKRHFSASFSPETLGSWGFGVHFLTPKPLVDEIPISDPTRVYTIGALMIRMRFWGHIILYL